MGWKGSILPRNLRLEQKSLHQSRKLPDPGKGRREAACRSSKGDHRKPEEGGALIIWQQKHENSVWTERATFLYKPL